MPGYSVEGKWVYPPAPPDLVHGSTSPSGASNGYSNYGCRCPLCKKAHKDYCERKRRDRIARGLAPDDPRHGTYTAYFNWGCRCEKCYLAHYVYVTTKRIKRGDVYEPIGPLKHRRKYPKRGRVESARFSEAGGSAGGFWLLLLEIMRQDAQERKARMPKLPTVAPRAAYSKMSPEDEAEHVALYLNHHGGGDPSVFGRIVRRFFDAHPEVQKAFVEWYEKQ